MRFWLVTLVCVLPTVALGHDQRPTIDPLPSSLGSRDPADADARVPRFHYRAITGAIRTYRPVDPMPWQERNRNVAPETKQEPAPPAKKP